MLPIKRKPKICPHCGSEVTEYIHEDSEYDSIDYTVKCHDCGCEFHEIFSIEYVGYYADNHAYDEYGELIK